MSYENPEAVPETANERADRSIDRPDAKGAANKDASGGSTPPTATVIVRGEAVTEAATPPAPNSQPSAKEPAPPAQLSAAKVKIQSRLPVLDDDADVGVQKNQVVVRDGKADLAFSGTLRASAAPATANKGRWQEYRIYETTAGKHVFSKVGRSVLAEDQDTHEAEVFDPSPESMPSQLLRSARDLVHTRPKTWTDAAVDFFGYDPLAKTLYRKLGAEFEERIA